jgi:hypothetical protein
MYMAIGESWDNEVGGTFIGFLTPIGDKVVCNLANDGRRDFDIARVDQVVVS